MTNPEDSAAVLEQLSRDGCTGSRSMTSGTGYSSMSYLRSFPIGQTEDRPQFHRGSDHSRADDASIVRAIVSLAHGLRLKVVAEGVETLEQAQVPCSR